MYLCSREHSGLPVQLRPQAIDEKKFDTGHWYRFISKFLLKWQLTMKSKRDPGWFVSSVQTAKLSAAAPWAKAVCKDMSTGSLCNTEHVATILKMESCPSLTAGNTLLHATSPKKAAARFKKVSTTALRKGQDYKVNWYRSDSKSISVAAKTTTCLGTLGLSFWGVDYSRVNSLELSKGQWTLKGRRTRSMLCGQMKQITISYFHFFLSTANCHL